MATATATEVQKDVPLSVGTAERVRLEALTGDLLDVETRIQQVEASSLSVNAEEASFKEVFEAAKRRTAERFAALQNRVRVLRELIDATPAAIEEIRNEIATEMKLLAQRMDQARASLAAAGVTVASMPASKSHPDAAVRQHDVECRKCAPVREVESRITALRAHRDHFNQRLNGFRDALDEAKRDLQTVVARMG